MPDSLPILDELIAKIEDMLRDVSGHNVVSAAEMQNGLLDLMQIARSMRVTPEDSL
jgi:hypothetical protein